MAHTCPHCGLNCHCNGDIDDCCFDTPETEDNCNHCDGDLDELEDDDWQGWCVICGANPCECAESI